MSAAQETPGQKRKRSEAPVVTPQERTEIMAGAATQREYGKGWDGTSLEHLRAEMYAFADERDWHQFHKPRNLLLALVGEVGEVSELFQWRGDDGATPGLPSWSEEDKVHLGEELSDVLLYLVRLSDRCGVDRGVAARRKMQKNRKKYPADRVSGSSAKYNEYKDFDEKEIRAAEDAAAEAKDARADKEAAAEA